MRKVYVLLMASVVCALVLPAFAAQEGRNDKLAIERLVKINEAAQLYMGDWDEMYPMHSSVDNPKYRWPDVLSSYVDSSSIFSAPGADSRIVSKTFVFDRFKGEKFGGFGYNYQYLGNSRSATASSPNLPFGAKKGDVARPSQTVFIADTAGARKENGDPDAVYVVDPPLGSDRGTGNGLFYGGSEPWRRATPAARHAGKVMVLFCDGHVSAVWPSWLDDSDRNGRPDNGFYNGYFDAANRR